MRFAAIALAWRNLFLPLGAPRNTAGLASIVRSAVLPIQSARGRFVTTELDLPGANGVVTLDYFAWDGSTRKLWVPAGNLASVGVIDGKTDEIT